MAKPATQKNPGSEKTKMDSVTTTFVADWVRDRVRRGRMVPGQRLIEADLINETGASRSRVREALQRLETEGLIAIEEFRGASVRRFSREELSAIYRTRAALEGLAAADFAGLATADNKQAIIEAQSALDAAVAAGDHDAFARSNDTWHCLIIEGCGNPYVIQFVDRLRVPVSRLLFSSFHSRQRLDDANADHRAITCAIVNGDVESAERLMRNHVDAGFQALVSQGLDE